MEEKNEKESRRFPYERPVLVNLSTSDFALYRGVMQCTPGSSATVSCNTGFIAAACVPNGASPS